MRIAALYDIHGNLPALQAVLAEVRRAGVEQIVVGGDVLPGPMPRETLRCLLDLTIPVKFIRGNGEGAVLAAMRGEEASGLPEQARKTVQWVAEQLTGNDRQVIESWPATVQVRVEGSGEVLFCHATPRNDTEIFTRLTAEEKLIPVFANVTADVVVCGHTHMQFDRTVGGLRVVNAGSVGMPFGEAGADWLLLGSTVALQQTNYDLAQAAELIAATAYPGAEEFAVRNVLNPPSEKEILELYGRAELR